MKGLAGDGPDTALARLLHATLRVRLEILRPLLEGARAGGRPLAESLLAQQILTQDELRAYQERLSGPTGRLGPEEVVGGRYRVVSLLGQGGMGAVYRALEVSTGRPIALKVLLPELAEDVDVRRFAAEGEIGARLGALTGFVPVHAAGTHRGLPYLAMALVEGVDLEGRIDALEARDLTTLLARVARSLHAAHEVGVVHRDLKPANILIDAEGLPLVADLGLARAGVTRALTQTGEILGTPSYMAPEQIEDPRRVDARSDVYALGAILYRGLSGAPPFQGPLLQVLDHVLTRPPEPLPAEAPRDVGSICSRALAKDPQERYPSALALAEDLERFARGERVAAALAPARGSRRAAWVAAGGVLLFAGAGIWAGSGRGEEPPQVLLPATPDRLQREEKRTSARFERELLVLAESGRGELEAIREDAERAGLDARALEAAVFRELRPACAARILAGEDPVKRFWSLRSAVRPELQRDPEMQSLSEDLFRGLLADDPNWLEVARLAGAIRPQKTPEFAKVRALQAFREAQAGLLIPPELARACLQLDVTLRGSGPLLFQRSLIPKTTSSLAFDSGSQTLGYLRLMDKTPASYEGYRDLSVPRQKEVIGLVGRVRAAPLKDLGQQYVLEVEILWLRCAKLQGAPSSKLLEQALALRPMILANDYTQLLFEVVALQAYLARDEQLTEVLKAEQELIDACLAGWEVHPNAKRDRENLLARTVVNLLRDQLVLERSEEAQALIDKIPPRIFDTNDLGSVKARYLELRRLCRAWSWLERDPGEAIRELNDLLRSTRADLIMERCCAQLLLARAHLALGAREEAEGALNALRARPKTLPENWWSPLRDTRDRLLQELQRR